MKQILKEPLLTFLVLGAAIFVLFQQLSNEPMPDNAEIVVTEGRINALSVGFAKVWQRPPNAQEMEHLIQNYIHEEVLYREALAMGLNRDDPIVRRRMRQKMEFISEDIAKWNAPTEQDLRTYLAQHQEQYRLPFRFSFQQIYFNSSERGRAAASSAATELLATLRKLPAENTDVKALGDPSMLKKIFRHVPDRDVVREFGPQFLQSLRTLPAGSWQGPINSAFGLHIVYIDERENGKTPALKDVHDAVLRDWSAAARNRVNKAFYEELRRRYTVTVESSPNRENASQSATVSMAAATAK